MTAQDLITEIEAIGGYLSIRGQKVRYRLPGKPESARLLDELRAHRDEVLAVLSNRCWHCRGAQTCDCIACWSGGRSACKVCRGTGEHRWTIQ